MSPGGVQGGSAKVKVFSRKQDEVVTNLVIDPYSLGLSANSTKSLVADLKSPLSKPASWGVTAKPPLRSVNDIVLYELHVRDFSAIDDTVPEQDRGKYTAFNHPSSNGMRHLATLAAAGLTHLHFLPAFNFSSVPELVSEQKQPEIEKYPDPASTQPQAAIAAVKDQDAYNWGYDPYHYIVPEGSYATSPHGLTRIREFRGMVQALHAAGLRVVMDVVYNHTAAAGQNPASVLDRIVPGYYYRLNRDGDELLRSKSFDRNSYNSGDWFNRLDFSYQTNNYGVGLPPEEENGTEWPLQIPLLRNPELKPGYAEIVSAHRFFLELLRIRKSTPLFRLATGDEIKARVAFCNTGPDQQPGLIVMTISDQTGADLDPDLRSVAVFFNADKVSKVMAIPEYAGLSLELHPIQRASVADRVVRESVFDARSGTFTIPARTTAVFIEPG